MAGMSAWLQNNMRNWQFRGGAAPAPPATWYVAYFTTMPDEIGGAGVECAGGSYARVAVPATAPYWSGVSAVDGRTTNLQTITFPTPTGGWGTVVALGLFDALAGGNLWYWNPVGNPRTVDAAAPPPVIDIGQLTLQFD